MIPAASTTATTVLRHDLYNDVHKGLRRALALLLIAAGQVDGDAKELAQVALRWNEVEELLHAHHRHEDEFIGPHVQRLAPALAAQIESEHAALAEEIRALGDDARAMRATEDDARLALGRRFYRRLASFVSAYFAHMAVEETATNEAFWAAFTDRELQAIEGALVASIAPDQMGKFLVEMLAAMNASECFQLLDGMRRAAPPPVFEGTRQLGRRVASTVTWSVVDARLDGTASGARAHA